MDLDLIEWLENQIEYKLGEMEKGETVYFQGEEIRTLLLIKEGWIKLFQTTPEGQEITLQIGGPNVLFPIVNLFNHSPCPESFRCLTNSKVFIFSLEEVERRLLGEPKALAAVITKINAVLENQIVFISAVHTAETRERIFKFLKHLAVQHGEKVESGYKLPFVLTQNDLAEMLNLSRVTVNGILSSLEEEGLILKQGGQHLVCLEQVENYLH